MTKKEDLVNSPKHYQSPKTTRAGDRLEALDVIKAFDLGFNLGNAVKYICRAEHKGATIQDLKKAAFYINDHIADLEAGRKPGAETTSKRGRQLKPGVYNAKVAEIVHDSGSNVAKVLFQVGKRKKEAETDPKILARREYQRKWRAKQETKAKKKGKK